MKKIILFFILSLTTLCSVESKSQVLADGVYNIPLTYEPGGLIDLAGGGMFNGCNIQLWEPNGFPNQKWIVENQPDGSVVLRYAASPNLVIDNSANRIANGNNIQLYEYNGSNAQKWYITGGTDQFVIRSKENRNYVIMSGGKNIGSNIILREQNDAPNQYWNFVAADPSAITFKKDRNGRLDLTGHGYQANNGDAVIGLYFDTPTAGEKSLTMASKKRYNEPGHWAITKPDRYTFDGKNLKISYMGYYGTVSPDGKTITLNMDGNKIIFKAVR